MLLRKLLQACPRMYSHSAKLYATAKPKIYITRQINDDTLNILQQSCEVNFWSGPGPVPRNELINNLEGTLGLFCMEPDKIDKEVLDAGKDLKVIATMSVGYNHLDVGEIKSRGIRIGYTPGVLTVATAELTMALLLATSRRLFEATEAVKNGDWVGWSPFWMCGPGLNQSTVGMVGFGRIGQKIAQMVKPFNPSKIIFYNRSARAEEAKQIGASRVGFDELLNQSDFIIVTCSLTPETKNLFNATAFKKMKNSAVFVNISRGDVVDQEALIDALEKGEIWGAGLDVMTPEPLPLDNKLLKLKNCVILPHIGSATFQTMNAMGIFTAKNLLAGLNNESMPAELKI